MRRHFLAKAECPAIHKNITLTDEIKEYILKNRIYIEEPVIVQPVPKITQIINQHNTMNNYISNIDTFVKLNHLVSFSKKELMNFDAVVEKIYEKDAIRFQTDSFKGDAVQYEQTHFLEMIHKVTKAQKPDLDDLSVLYNRDEDRVYISMGSGKWDDLQRDHGVTQIVESLAAYCLEYYEVYLIRKLEKTRNVINQSLRMCLEEYYKFISTFGVKPFVHDKSDQTLFEDEDEDDDGEDETYDIVDKYKTLYGRISSSQSETQKRHTLKAVVDVIKMSTKTNLRDLNKKIMSIINMDHEFKQKILAM